MDRQTGVMIWIGSVVLAVWFLTAGLRAFGRNDFWLGLALCLLSAACGFGGVYVALVAP
ncbi:MAG: hypothetical protein ABW067_15620 [Rhizobacter sp.]